MFKPFLEVSTVDESTVRVDARGSAVFTNWLPFRRTLRQVGIEGRNNVVLNLEGTNLIDHRVMEGLHELQEDFAREDLALDIVGLEGHHPLSAHQFATRRRRSG
jgi:MFS superfamily sulfate permease-like transporter